MVVDLLDPAARRRRYTTQELLATANAHGHRPTKRMLTDWVSEGLLDKGTPIGRGRGKGKTYTWSYNQLRLFLAVLDKSHEGKRATLLNIPVLFWMIWGDAYVPLRQARRALESWAGVHARTGIGRATKTAREVLAYLDHPRASREDRNRLLELIVTAAYRAELDRGEFLDVATRVFNPQQREIAAVDAPMTPDNYVRVLEARVTALRELKTLPNELFKEARLSYQTAGPTAELTRAALADDPRLTAPGPSRAMLNGAANQACLDLLTLLGLLLTAPPPANRSTATRPGYNPSEHRSRATSPQNLSPVNRPRDRANGPGARHTKDDSFRMHPQRTERPSDGVCLAHGYGLKIYVERGHLIVHDGIGRQRETRCYHRATSRLRRLLVIGHTGFVTLEALRWVHDTGAVFVHVGADGELITLSAPARHHESKLRRAQVLAAESDLGRVALVALLEAKLERQADLVERLSHLKATVRVKDAHPIRVADAIRGYGAELDPAMPFARLRELESAAGRNYWQTWARVPARFARDWQTPEHWQLAGSRTSYLDRKRARKATTPVHALLNYAYAILEVEATIAAHRLGFDPSLGIMHADQRYRSSLATDLMEPARPGVDGLVLDLLEHHVFARGELYETREGVCRIGATLARRLAGWAPQLRGDVAPHAEQLARTLLAAPNHATPLTRQRHRKALVAATS